MRPGTTGRFVGFRDALQDSRAVYEATEPPVDRLPVPLSACSNLTDGRHGSYDRSLTGVAADDVAGAHVPQGGST